MCTIVLSIYVCGRFVIATHNALGALLSAFKIWYNLPIDDNTSRAAGIIVVDDQDDRLVEHTAKTLVGNQNTTGLNVGDLQTMPINGTEQTNAN